MPVAFRGRGGAPSTYNLARVSRWLETRQKAAERNRGASELMAVRARRDCAQAALMTQVFQIRNGDLLPTHLVERAMSAQVAAVRTKLLSWRQTLSDRLFAAWKREGQAGVASVLDAAIEDTLGELHAEPMI